MPFRSLSSLHWNSSTRKELITTHGARLFGVSEEQFSNWRWQMKNQVASAEEAMKILKLSDSESDAFVMLREIFDSGVTPYYLALMNPDNEYCPVRLQAVPRLDEINDRIGVADPLQEVGNSPVKEVVHVYKDRVAFCVAQLCPVYCRYCFRKRRDAEVGLHFNPKIVDKGIEYIASNPEIRDVLITGGDPLIAQDATLENLLAKLRAIPHVQILRIGTRVPVTLPYRITEELAEMLARFHPLWLNTHFNCTEELTPEAAAAIDTLLSRGIPVGNQSVLLAGVNDTNVRLKGLLEGLVRMRVRPYYLYQAQTVEGTAHLRVPIEKGLDLMRSLRGNTTGFAIPQYVLDTPTGKIPLSPNQVVGRDKDEVVLLDLKKSHWREVNPLGSYETAAPLPNLSEL